ncbi:EcsC family protein, partial [Myxococcota bacterium]|nr:EcsC family protein [Myxococcota bacterium]
VATQTSLEKAIRVAAGSTNVVGQNDTGDKFIVGASGAVGGFFGLPGLILEVPISTTVIMRSVLGQAANHNFDIHDGLVQAEALTVFALGGPSADDDAAESAYYASRIVVQQALGKLAAELAERELAEIIADKGATTLARLIAAVASRFSPQVAEKIAAGSVPVVGAAAAAAINLAFISHFQNIGEAHFAIREYEELYGEEAVRTIYLSGP